MQEFIAAESRDFTESAANERNHLALGGAIISVYTITSRRAWIGFPLLYPNQSGDSTLLEWSRRKRFTHRRTIGNCTLFNTDYLRYEDESHVGHAWGLSSASMEFDENVDGATDGLGFVPASGGFGNWKRNYDSHTFGYDITPTYPDDGLTWRWLMWPTFIDVPDLIYQGLGYYGDELYDPKDGTVDFPVATNGYGQTTTWSLTSQSTQASEGYSTRIAPNDNASNQVIGWNLQVQVMGDEIPVSAPVTTMLTSLDSYDTGDLSTSPYQLKGLFFSDFFTPAYSMFEYGAIDPQINMWGTTNVNPENFFPELFPGDALTLEDIGQTLSVWNNDEPAASPSMSYESVSSNGYIKSGWWWNPFPYYNAVEYDGIVDSETNLAPAEYGSRINGFCPGPYVSAAKRWVKSTASVSYFIAQARIKATRNWNTGLIGDIYDTAEVIDSGTLAADTLLEIPLPDDRGFETVDDGTISFGQVCFIVFGESQSAFSTRTGIPFTS